MATLNIPVTKAGRTIEVDTDKLSEDVYAHVFAEGLKVLLNKNMSKILTKDLEGDELDSAKSAALAKAQENLDKLYKGEVKASRSGVKTADGKKVPGIVMTEARRLAKEIVKNEIRNAGHKISHYEPSEITKLANELIANDPYYIDEATKNIEARSSKKPAVNVASLISESPKLVAAANEKKAKAQAERKTTLSAKSAGKVAPRKGSAPQPTAH